ncbi:MAG TPA: hypothetical protein VGQ95_08355 [Chthoniobacterales bacterium]|nr:hypothetical protein [Chthoniobacterales bacterium]
MELPSLEEQQPSARPKLVGLSYRGRQLTEKVSPCEISTADLRRLYTDLDRRSSEALSEHLSTLKRPSHMSEQEFKAALEEIRDNAQLAVTIHGSHGDQILQRTADALADENLPSKIRLVRFDSAQAMQFIHRDQQPLNRFYVLLDFTEPPGFNKYNPWVQPTPNTSEFSVNGNNEMWVTGVHQFIKSFFKDHRRNRHWLHSNRFFNVAHWVIGFPAALWIMARSGYYIPELQKLHPAILGAIYIYLSLLALVGFRGLIFALRWLYPVVEITGSRPKPTIRATIVLVVLALFTSLIYDVLKFVFTGR